jgi:flagellar motility protein MotE (MotC chaperone)
LADGFFEAGFLPAIGINISFWPDAAFFGFLVGFFVARVSPAAPPTLRRSASIRSTTFSPLGRAFAVIGLPARFWLIRSTRAVSYWSSNLSGSKRLRREREEAKEEAARQKQRERRQQAVNKAQKTLEKAEQEHTQRVAELRAQIDVIEKKVQAEDVDWHEEKKRLNVALRRARD